MKLNKPVTVKFTFIPTKVVKDIGKFLWKLAPWAIILFLLLTRSAHAATIPPTAGRSESSSNGGLSSLIVKPTPSTELITKIEDAQKPPPPAPVAPAPEPLLTEPTYDNPYAWGNCTQYVASVVHVPDNLGNANTWAVMASQDGYEVSPTPKVGAVAQTTAGSLGHVALVEAVDGTNIEIKEMNAVGLGVTSERWVDATSFNYIYF